MDTKFKFNYSKYQASGFTVKEWDEIAKSILISGSSKFQSIIAGIKILFLGIWYIVRCKMIDNELEIARQNYLQHRTQENRNDVDIDIPNV